MFQVLPGDLTAAKGSGNISPLNPSPLRNITPLSMLLRHDLAGIETDQAKPLLSKKELFISKLQCQAIPQEPVTLLAVRHGGQRERALIPWGRGDTWGRCSWGFDPPRDLGLKPEGSARNSRSGVIKRQELAWERRRRGAAERAAEGKVKAA